MKERFLRILAPCLLLTAFVGLWEYLVRFHQIPVYILPGPDDVFQALISEWPSLWSSLLITLTITLSALALAVLGGVLLALVFSLSKTLEYALYPFAILLQVTPVVAIAPLILIYVDNTFQALLIVAWIVAFFPVLSNTLIGLKSADRGLYDLFSLYGASTWHRFVFLRFPTALPYFLAGLKIAGGLSLIGAVVAEYVAGSAGAGSGLAYRILESGYRLQIPKMFAALFLLAVTGIVLFIGFSLLSRLLLGRWHESYHKQEKN